MRSTILILLFAALLSPAARAEEKTPEAFARIETELKQERPDAWEIKDIIYHAPAFSADEKQKIAELEAKVANQEMEIDILKKLRALRQQRGENKH